MKRTSSIWVVIAFLAIVVGLILTYSKPAHSRALRPLVVDLTRIVNAENYMAVKSSQAQNMDWQTALTKDTKKVKDTIKEISHGRVVYISQAIVVGKVIDITDMVLKKLNLPTNIPALAPPKQLVMGGMAVSSKKEMQDKANQATAKQESDFLKP